jgi:hypothetical protein
MHDPTLLLIQANRPDKRDNKNKQKGTENRRHDPANYWYCVPVIMEYKTSY